MVLGFVVVVCVCAGGRTQGYMHAKHKLYHEPHLSPTPAPSPNLESPRHGPPGKDYGILFPGKNPRPVLHLLRDGLTHCIRVTSSFCLLYLLVPFSLPNHLPGVVSEPKSQVPQERESHAGQQKRFPPQILLRRRECRGAAHRTSSCSKTHRLSLLGHSIPIQVNDSPALPCSTSTRSSAIGHAQSCVC